MIKKIIGIDARPLESDNPSGIGTYVSNILSYFDSIHDDNKYILYSTKPISKKYVYSSKFHNEVVPANIGTIFVRYKLSNYLIRDNVNLFWGTEHILPKNVPINIKRILTVHDLSLLKNPRWGSYKNALMQHLFARHSIKNADLIITVSESTKRDIVKITKYNSKNITVIHLGVNPPIKHYSIAERNIIFDKFKIRNRYFLYVGTIEPRKNLNTIVKAFERFSTNSNGELLVIAGGFGWKYKDLLRLIKSSKYSDRIILTGYISEEDKEVLYNGAICLLFPSHYEGFGLPILEAFMNRCLVITANNSSLKEVGGELTYYLDNENDFVELAELMKKVEIIQPEDKEKIIQANEKRAKKYTWKKCGKRTYDVIKSTDNYLDKKNEVYEK